jgi:N-acetyl-anhydromuramyl-L-alanine amidase AmpD
VTVLVDSREVPCAVRVDRDPALRFEALARRTETRAVVLHWTGGSGLAPQVFRTLQQRKLSVHFCVEPSGRVVQYADASLRCAHAGAANGWSIGVEIVNPASPAKTTGQRQVAETIHGKRVRYGAFTDAQLAATLDLTEALCRAYGLPLSAPSATTALSPSELRTVRGVLGHLHITRAKLDPGLEVLRFVTGAA